MTKSPTGALQRDQSFIVYRTLADLRCLYAANSMGRTISLTAFLSR